MAFSRLPVKVLTLCLARVKTLLSFLTLCITMYQNFPALIFIVRVVVFVYNLHDLCANFLQFVLHKPSVSLKIHI